jgi:hypothetical protein
MNNSCNVEVRIKPMQAQQHNSHVRDRLTCLEPLVAQLNLRQILHPYKDGGFSTHTHPYKDGVLYLYDDGWTEV